jgi:GR25 family glycosyltransferase involved in LPS biosynthesis
LKTFVSYILYAEKEIARKEQVLTIKKFLPEIIKVDAIFPKYTKVPFLDKMILLSKKRTGKALVPAEIGVLLGHRKIWKSILNSNIPENEHALIVESDSRLVAPELLFKQFNHFTSPFDIFFWGAWDGNTRLKKSSLIFNNRNLEIGEPLIKSVYCTYGYSVNKKAAKYLLKATGKINYPVDMYKKHIKKGDLKIGAARPEIISSWNTTPSSIQQQNKIEKIKRFFIVQIFDFRNRIQAHFS